MRDSVSQLPSFVASRRSPFTLASSAFLWWAASLIILLLGVMVLDGLAAGTAMWMFPKGSGATYGTPWGAPILPDTGFALIPYIPALVEPLHIPTLVLTGFMLITLLVVVVFDGQWLILCRFCAADAFCLFLRTVAIVGTTYNNPNPMCATCGTNSACPATLIGSILLTFKNHFPFWSCGDLAVSGHTINLLLTALMWGSYTGRWARACRVVVWTVVVPVVIFLLLAARFHYTNDILWATMITLLIWAYLDLAPLSPSTSWWSRFVRYITTPPPTGNEEGTDFVVVPLLLLFPLLVIPLLISITLNLLMMLWTRFGIGPPSERSSVRFFLSSARPAR